MCFGMDVVFFYAYKASKEAPTVDQVKINGNYEELKWKPGQTLALAGANRPIGGSGGNPFNFNVLPTQNIDGIRVRHGAWIDAIQIRIDGVWSKQYGGNGGSMSELILGKNEYINQMNCCGNAKHVTCIKPTTTLNNTMQFGPLSGRLQCFNQPGMILSNIKGRSGDYLDQIEFEWKPMSTSPLITPTTSSPTKNCVKCSTALVQDAKFCSKCGTQQPTNNSCISCNNILLPGSKFCGKCGKPQNSDNTYNGEGGTNGSTNPESVAIAIEMNRPKDEYVPQDIPKDEYVPQEIPKDDYVPKDINELNKEEEDDGGYKPFKSKYLNSNPSAPEMPDDAAPAPPPYGADDDGLSGYGQTETYM